MRIGKLRTGPAYTFGTALCLSAMVLPAVAQTPPIAPAACQDQPIHNFGPLAPFQEDLERGAIRCLSLQLKPGELVRAVFEIGVIPPLTGASLELVSPGDTVPALRVVLGNVARQAVSWEGTTEGLHHLVVRDIWSIDPTVGSIPTGLWVEAIEPPSLVQARREALAADPRVDWLARNALPVRSIAADDNAFDDLEPLRAALDGVRLVLLGESDHWSGSDLLAKSRLVRFLHSEMGFDVLAFESSMYGMAVAWDSIRAGAPASTSFGLGAWPFWARSEQMQPLIEYIGQRSGSEQPLEVAGFDVQFIRPGSGERFAEEMADFLSNRGIGGPLADRDSPEWGVVESLGNIRYKVGEESLPDAATRRAVLEALDESANATGGFEDAQAELWTEILRSTSSDARMNFDRAEGATIHEATRHRNDQMAEHLLWLANERYPGRKVIAWAGTGHVMRLPAVPPAAGIGPSMGQRIGEALGPEAFVITTTYFEGENFGSDQHPLAEFEELMHEAGFDLGIVDLRRAAAEGSWPGGPFLARPFLHTESRVWSNAADAFFFIRKDERTRPFTP